MDTDVSQLIRSLRLIMVMGLVFVHFSNFPGDNLDPFSGVVEPVYIVASSFNSFFTYFFLCSVPVLSAISGYLYCYDGTPSFRHSLKKKTKTLILPYLTWTTIWLLLAFVLYSIGRSSNQFTYYDQGFSDYSLFDLLNGIIGINQAPFAFQFWFVHDLILSILISPIIITAIKKLGKIIILIPFVLWILEVEPWVFLSFKVIAFFNLGLYVGINQIQLKIPKNLSWLNTAIVFFILMVLIRIYLPAYNKGDMPFDTIYELILRLVGSIAIIAIILNIRAHLSPVYFYLVNQSGYAFFLHAFHFPLIIIIKQILFMTGLFKGNAGMIILWIGSIIITFAIALISAKLINRFTPSLYTFLNGQRSI